MFASDLLIAQFPRPDTYFQQLLHLVRQYYSHLQKISVDAMALNNEQDNLELRTKSSNKGKNDEPKQIKSFFAKLFS